MLDPLYVSPQEQFDPNTSTTKNSTNCIFANEAPILSRIINKMGFKTIVTERIG